MNEENKVEYGTFDGIIVLKDDLIKSIKENKEKHDEIFTYASKAYEDSVEKYVFEYKDYFVKVGAEYNGFADCVGDQYVKWDKSSNFSFNPPRIEAKAPTQPLKPSNYSNEYETAIRRIEMSVYDKFKLTENEFQSYIMNNWSWKAKFLSDSTSLLWDKAYYTGSFVASGMTVSGRMQNF